MNKSLTLLFTLCFAVFSYAQSTLSGKVLDEDGQPLPSASVTVEEPGKDAIIAYGISNSKGEYKVTFTTLESNVDVKIKAFNQRPIVRQVKNATQQMNFNLQPEATEIKEVKLQAKLITKRGDTLSYDLKQFESASDRTLADVLKKLPGIEVSSSGAILYQGEPINKFYVNGKDPMEGGYGALVKALPKDAIQKMEVLENHQPVKVLQDKVPSENAAINIKLKNKVTMTGRGEVGVGMDPLLWNVKLTPMFFGQKNQWVVNYKANNNGESVENERNILAFGNRWEGMRRQASQRNWLSIDNAGTPNIPEKRHLRNNVHFFSANLLTNPFKNKEWELKLNTNYVNNALERDSYTETVYEPSNFFPNGASATTRISNNLYDNSAKGEMIFTKNAKKGFFKNTTTWNGFWNEDRAISNIFDPEKGNIFIGNGMSSPSGMFQNSLSTIIPFKEKMVNFQSYISYQKDRQKLNADYDNFDGLDEVFGFSYQNLQQDLELQSLNLSHSASVGFSYKKWTITPEVGLNLSFNDMNSQLYGNRSILGSNFINDMEWNEVNPYTRVGFNYKGQGLQMNFNLPMNFYGMDYKDLYRNTGKEISTTKFEPSFWGSYDFASFWKIWAFGSVSYRFGEFGSLYSGDILTSPRFISNNDNALPENRSMSFSPRIEYRNPLNNLFFNVRYSRSNVRRNLVSSGIVSTISGNNRFVEIENTTYSESESAEIGKYFPKFKSNISANFSNNDSNSYFYLGELMESKNNRQSFGFKFNNTYFSWMSLDYSIAMNWNKNTNLRYNNEIKSSGWSHNLSAYFYPIENHTIGFFWDDLTTSQADETFRNSFYDLSYQYTWNKKKIDFEVKWLNIANKDVYETISYNPTYLSTTRRSINIRPSQVMFTVKFNFK